LKAANIPIGAQQSFLAGFKSGWARSEQSLKEMIDLERQSIDTLVSMLDLVEGHLDQVTERNGRLLFYRVADMNAYNHSFEQLRSIAEQLQQLREINAQRTRQTLDRLASTIPDR